MNRRNHSPWLAQFRFALGTHVQYNAKRNYRWRSAFLALPGSPVFENSTLWMSPEIAFRQCESAHGCPLTPAPSRHCLPAAAGRVTCDPRGEEGENKSSKVRSGTRDGVEGASGFRTVFQPFTDRLLTVFHRFSPFLRFSEKPPETRTARCRRISGARKSLARSAASWLRGLYRFLTRGSGMLAEPRPSGSENRPSAVGDLPIKCPCLRPESAPPTLL